MVLFSHIQSLIIHHPGCRVVQQRLKVGVCFLHHASHVCGDITAEVHHHETPFPCGQWPPVTLQGQHSGCMRLAYAACFHRAQTASGSMHEQVALICTYPAPCIKQGNPAMCHVYLPRYIPVVYFNGITYLPVDQGDS